ncbi:septum formation protein Maf [Paraliobacillus quinghaiensis]|uniref:dTTP/UTP pyrophosphatase n=1 Tax=Paraliobacillus quinghaiensis TaxID=470815 RepID=A0A917TK60_9BACI|nr:Maf family protein [Paraliobacillus quinghaiensis]GGM26186.1 septum formation protein Maf [Paraliobacillus quinghaiensis]
MSKQLILASSSPRRQGLLEQVNIPFSIRKPDIDESQIKTNDPYEKVKQLAIRKAQEVQIETEDEVILTADTVVSYNQTIFEKPKNKEEAYKMIASLSGEIHEVFTGFMIKSLDNEVVFVERTKVEFWPLSSDEINWYISTKDPYDKAGAYGIQSYGAMFVKQIFGDYYNVVGLPISRVVRELRNFSIYPKNS